MTATTARDIVTAEEFFNQEARPEVALSKKGENWLLGSFGFLLGSSVEAGANVGALVPCVGQIADVSEALYFTYFYIRGFIKERHVDYISYMSVYVSRGIDAVTYGPCWQLANKESPEPSQQQMDAETFLAFDHLTFISEKGKKKLRSTSTWDETLDADDAFGELKNLTSKIANKLT